MIWVAEMALSLQPLEGCSLDTQSHLLALPRGTFETETPPSFFFYSINQSFCRTSFYLVYIWGPGTLQNPSILGVMGSQWPSPVLGRGRNLPHSVSDLRVGGGLPVVLWLGGAGMFPCCAGSHKRGLVRNSTT